MTDLVYNPSTDTWEPATEFVDWLEDYLPGGSKEGDQ